MTSRDAPMNGPGDAREPASRGHVLLVSFAAVLGIIVVLFGLVLALAFLADQKAAPNLLANIYDLLGKNADATALRSGQGDRTVAKLLMTVVAIVIGVGGVWLFYIGANALVERLGIRWQRRLLPWVFIGPAVVLLTVFLVYPAVATIVAQLHRERRGHQELPVRVHRSGHGRRVQEQHHLARRGHRGCRGPRPAHRRPCSTG